MKSALVTGAGGGLGREVAVQLSRRGCAVAVLDIKLETVEATADLCRGAGAEALKVVDDLTRAGASEDAVNAVTGAWGRLDILVNNAGYGAIEPFLAMTAAVWHKTLSLNVTALALACAAAGRVMRDQRSGRIVNITSPASRMALPNYTAYAASKAGVDAITRAAAVALAPFGVLVNSVAPGFMRTSPDYERQWAGYDAAFRAQLLEGIAMRRMGTPEDIAYAVLFLASDYASWITGQVLPVTGSPVA